MFSTAGNRQLLVTDNRYWYENATKLCSIVHCLDLLTEHDGFQSSRLFGNLFSYSRGLTNEEQLEDIDHKCIARPGPTIPAFKQLLKTFHFRNPSFTYLPTSPPTSTPLSNWPCLWFKHIHLTLFINSLASLRCNNQWATYFQAMDWKTKRKWENRNTC